MQLNLTKSIELSNSHITKEDFLLLDRMAAHYRDTLKTNDTLVPAVLATRDGYVICIGSRTIAGLIEAGASKAFKDILDYCQNAHDGAIMYLAFDRDAEVEDDLPTFDW